MKVKINLGDEQQQQQRLIVRQAALALTFRLLYGEKRY
jgi:hypothetical protein